MANPTALERVWVWRDHANRLYVEQTRLTAGTEAVEYMRVMSRQEVEKLAGDGVDVQQYLNSLLRTIEGQRREINRLKATIERYSEAMEEDGDV